MNPSAATVTFPILLWWAHPRFQVLRYRRSTKVASTRSWTSQRAPSVGNAKNTCMATSICKSPKGNCIYASLKAPQISPFSLQALEDIWSNLSHPSLFVGAKLLSTGEHLVLKKMNRICFFSLSLWVKMLLGFSSRVPCSRMESTDFSRQTQVFKCGHAIAQFPASIALYIWNLKTQKKSLLLNDFLEQNGVLP